MAFQTIKFDKEGHVALLTLDHSEAGNTVNGDMVAELKEATDRINADNEVYAVILTGAGDVFYAFSDGETGEVPPTGPAEAIAGIDRPVVAAINGDALGPGLEIALAGDIRIAASTARFGLPQVSRGMIPADGGTQRLPRIVGRGKALELLLTGDIIPAAEALDIGLVRLVVPPEELAVEARKLAGTIVSKGPIALRYLKEAVNKGMDMTLEQGLRLEADLYFLLHTTADRTEGIRAFLEKREPEYKGE